MAEYYSKTQHYGGARYYYQALIKDYPGTPYAQQAAQRLDEIKGKPLEEIRQLNKETILELLGIPLGPTRIKCALLSLKVAKGGAYGMHEWPGEEE